MVLKKLENERYIVRKMRGIRAQQRMRNRVGRGCWRGTAEFRQCVRGIRRIWEKDQHRTRLYGNLDVAQAITYQQKHIGIEQAYSERELEDMRKP